MLAKIKATIETVTFVGNIVLEVFNTPITLARAIVPSSKDFKTRN